MNLVIQGPDVETTVLKQLAKLSGATGIEQVAPNVFHLKKASPADGIAELCAKEPLNKSHVERVTTKARWMQGAGRSQYREYWQATRRRRRAVWS